MPFQRSPNTERALRLPRPRLRGLSHRAAFLLSVPAGLWLVLAAPAGRPRLATAVFAAGVAVMLGLSALYHARRWSPHVSEILLRADHTGIFVAIAGTATPIALLGLSGWEQTALLVGAWAGAAVGTVLIWLPFATPRGFANTFYLTMGWLPLLLLPALWRNAGPVVVGLMLLGGVLYTSGAVIVALRRPDPAPHVFGYHEIFHVLVIGAVAAHYGMVVTLV